MGGDPQPGAPILTSASYLFQQRVQWGVERDRVIWDSSTPAREAQGAGCGLGARKVWCR